MPRVFAIVCALLAAILILGVEPAQAQKNNQMVKGTIKEVQVDKDVLVINQKVKKEFVDRELSILNTTVFMINKKGSAEQKVTGSQGLKILAEATNGGKGASVQIKCDKDVNVLSVKVMLK